MSTVSAGVKLMVPPEMEVMVTASAPVGTVPPPVPLLEMEAAFAAGAMHVRRARREKRHVKLRELRGDVLKFFTFRNVSGITEKVNNVPPFQAPPPVPLLVMEAACAGTNAKFKMKNAKRQLRTSLEFRVLPAGRQVPGPASRQAGFEFTPSVRSSLVRPSIAWYTWNR